MKIEAALSNQLPTRKTGKRVSWLATTLITTKVFLIGFFVWGVARFRSVINAIKYVFGKTLISDSAVKSFGVGYCGHDADVTFHLRNHSSESVRIVGCKMGCSCTTPMNKMPFVMAPGEETAFRISLHLLEEPTNVHMTVTLYTNNPDQPELDLTVIGEVVQATGEHESAG